MKISIEKIRRALAVVMLVVIFLPLAQCTQKKDAAPNTVPAKPYVLVIAENVKWQQPQDWSGLALFVWPWPTLVLLAFVRRRAVRIATHALELLVCGWVAWYAGTIIALYGEIRYGGVIWLGSLLLYFGFTAYCLVWQVRKKTA